MAQPGEAIIFGAGLAMVLLLFPVCWAIDRFYFWGGWAFIVPIGVFALGLFLGTQRIEADLARVEAFRRGWYEANECRRSHYVGGRRAELVHVCKGGEYLWRDIPRE
jgi:hypothetical protein